MLRYSLTLYSVYLIRPCPLYRQAPNRGLNERGKYFYVVYIGQKAYENMSPQTID